MKPLVVTIIVILSLLIAVTETFTPANDGFFRFTNVRKQRKYSGPLPDVNDQRQKRVPDVLEPLDYYIRIRPYFPADTIPMPQGKDNMSFDGLTTFVFRVKEQTNNLILHSVDLTYTTTTLMDEDSNPIEHTFYKNVSYEQITISPKNHILQLNKTYILQFEYTGKINVYTVAGLYYTSYTDIQGNTHWMIASHFEAALARRVFPCMDEPGFKAVFHITLIYPKGYIALANTMERDAFPVQEMQDAEYYGWNVIQFPPSVKMSTYLVAFAIGPFVNQNATTDDGILVRVWGWTGQEEYLKNALDATIRCLGAMTKFTKFKYPMTKTDQLGLPEFIAGAMENYGLIIYKYQYIVFNPKVHNTYDKEGAIEVSCHELAHQWFGDTVTAKWWDDLFLQEGMAAFFQNYAAKLGYPEQQEFLEAKFMVHTVEAALTSDAVVNDSHALYYWDGPAFDDITYDKGASVLRMIQYTLGNKVFEEALQDYIASYQFSNADHDMFFAKLTKASANQTPPIKDWCGQLFNASIWLKPWFYQQSFPLVTVTNNQLMEPATLSQEPFNNINDLPPNGTQSMTNYNYTWPIPLFSKNYMNETTVTNWLVPDYAKKHCPQKDQKPSNKALHWEMYNVDSRVVMRTQYDDIGYARLLKELRKEPSHFTPVDRIVLIGDQIALVNKKKDAGEQFTFQRVLEMIDAIIPLKSYFGTFELARSSFLNQLEKMFIDSTDYGLFQLFVKRLVAESYNSLGWNISGDWDRDITRYLTLPYAVRYNLSDAVQQGQKHFKQFLIDCKDAQEETTGCTKIHPDLRQSVYCAGIMVGDDNDFNTLLKFYQQEYKYDFYYYQEFYTMLQGLSCTTSQQNVEKLIPYMLSTYRLPQNRYNLASLPLYFLTQTPKVSEYMADYLMKNLSLVISSGNLEEYLNSMTSSWFFKRHLRKYESLYAQLNSTLNSEQRILFDKYNAIVRQQTEVAKMYLPDIIRFLYDNRYVVAENKENWVKPLQKDLKPVSYNLTVRPYFPGSAPYPWWKNLTFDGSVTIKGTVLRTTKKISLNAHRLIIEPEDVTFRIDAFPDGICEFDTFIKDYQNGILDITLKNCTANPDQNFTLSIVYKGLIFGEPKKGVYTNTNYFEYNNQQAWIFATYFKSGPSARSLVPCFDEPQYKATWTVTLMHPADTIALGNMPSQRMSIGNNGWATTMFLPTPPMSSYLLSLAAGHFASLQTVSKTGILVRTWAWTGMEQYSEHALKTVAGTIDFMSDYFNFSYPLPKLDVLALPQYTSLSGGEEHWGLIHVRYFKELIDFMNQDAATYMDVASVCAHETIHQWFGNLVTMQYWNEVFLSEGFADYWETNGVMAAFPEQSKYEKYERFRKASVALTYDTDPLLTKPIIDFTPSYFTGETYYKGATVLHMLSNTITPFYLQAGLRLYLKENAFGNVNESILWNAINKAVKKQIFGWNGTLDVAELMKPWMHQATMPVLKVEKNGSAMKYSQEPYIKNISASGEWTIPLWSRDSNGNESLHYFTAQNNTDPYWTRQFEDTGTVDNVEFRSFVIVWYDDNTWSPIFRQLKNNINSYDEITRAQFITDTYYLLKRGSLTWSRLLDLGSLLDKEDSLTPFYSFSKVIDQLLSGFRNTSFENKVVGYIRTVIKPLYDRIGWSHTDNWTQDQLASLVTEYACKTGYQKCLAKANETFIKFITSCQYSESGTRICNRISLGFHRTMYCYGLRQNPLYSNIVERLYKWSAENEKYFNTDTDNLLYSLSCIQTEQNFNSILDNILKGIYPSKAFDYVAENQLNIEMLKYFKNHPESLYGVADFTDFITAAAKTYTTQAQLTELQSLKSILKSDEDLEALKGAEDIIKKNINWVNINVKPESGLIPWLDNHNFGAI